MEQLVEFLPKGFSLFGMAVAAWYAFKYVVGPLVVKAGGWKTVESKAFTELEGLAHNIEARVLQHDATLAATNARLKSIENTVAATNKPPAVPQPPQSPGG